MKRLFKMVATRKCSGAHKIGAKKSELGTRSFFPGSLSAQFLSMDRYRSFGQFSGSLIAQSLSQKPVVHSWKRAIKRLIAPKTTVVRSH